MELIDTKVDDLMSLATNVNWLPDEQRSEPNDYVLDLIAYLHTTFACMQHMPDGFRQAIHFTSAKHIADAYMHALCATGAPSTSAPPQFNIIALHALHMDVCELEQFACACDIADLDSKFAEVRQTLDLFLSGNIEQILDAPTRAARFAQVNLTRLGRAMAKFAELGFFVRHPPALPKLRERSVQNVMQALSGLR